MSKNCQQFKGPRLQTGKHGWLWTRGGSLTSCNQSVDPFGEVVGALQLCGDLLRVHRLVLGEVLGVFPLKELDSIFGDCLTAEVAVRCCLLVLGLTERQRHRDGPWAAVEGDLDYVGVDDDLAACEACIALWAANDELPGGIDVQMREVAVERESRLAVLQEDL